MREIYNLIEWAPLDMKSVIFQTVFRKKVKNACYWSFATIILPYIN